MINRIILVNLVIPFVILLCNGDCDFECPFDKKCLRLSAVCNGTKECSFGEDELHVNCKNPITSRPRVFYCANGVPIAISQMCNKKIDCIDKSDESTAICKEYKIQLDLRIENSTCENPELSCQASTQDDCISADKICDNKFDCPNGRDESIEMCMQELRYPHFQCGNGKIIYNSSQLCDNKYDCLDGSDELETHCQFNEKWIPKQAVTCAEPKRNGLKFMSNTTMYAKKKNNETHYFVYASGAVQFECYNSDEDFEGIKWNVCTIDENGNGRWLHELPKCVDNRNKNPKTNGDLGCSLDTYDDYKANLRIWKCSHDGTNCVKKIEPPLTDANVKFNCSKNFMLFPEILREKTFRCRNKTWQLGSQEASPKPRCGKMCSTSELYCLDSMEPKCKTRNGENIECNLTTLEPGTTVTYDCLPQYKENNSKFTSVCLNNGTWEHSGNRKEYCSIKCGVNELQTSMSANAPVTHLHLSPWSVAIYDNKDTQQFQYSCGGVLIRHNFVLTVAHCVSDRINKFGINRFRVMPAQKANVSIIDSHNDCRKTNETNKDEADKHSECWIVQQIIIDPKYNPAEYTFDSALLHLEANPYLPFKIVCIPKIHFLWDKGYTNRKGSVFTWDTEKRKSDQKLNFVIVDGTLNIADNIAKRNFYINVTSYGNVKTTLCIGDSGCGFFDDCPNGNKMCLFGIVSTTITLNENYCTSNVKINSVVYEGTAEFVNKTMHIISNRCPK